MKYDDFINQVRTQAGLDSIEDAVKAVRATLETLAERLSADDAKDLASRLPPEITYFLRRSAVVFDRFGLDEFFKRVSEREEAQLPDATFHATVVISVLHDAATNGERNAATGNLPEEFLTIWHAFDTILPEVG